MNRIHIGNTTSEANKSKVLILTKARGVSWQFVAMNSLNKRKTGSREQCRFTKGTLVYNLLYI